MNSKDAVFLGHADRSKMSYRLRCYENRQTAIWRSSSRLMLFRESVLQSEFSKVDKKGN